MELWYYSHMGILSSVLSSAAINAIISAVYKRSQTPYTHNMPNIGSYVKVSVNV